MTHAAELPVAPAFRNGGTSQAERLPTGLLPASLLLDARTPLELLGYVARLSESVPFYTDPAGPPAGFWALAQHRQLLLLALVATQPAANRADDSAAQLALLHTPNASPAQQRQARQYLLSRLYRELARLTSWRLYYGSNLRPTGFISALETAWQHLLDPLSQVARYEALLLAEQLIDGPSQLAEELAGMAVAEAATAAATDQARYRQGTLTLASITAQLLDAFMQVQKELDTLAAVAEQSFHESLAGQQNHHPEVALLVAFVQLFGQAQAVLNGIPHRHLDYYYRQVLRMAPRPSVPDEVNLVFTLGSGRTRGQVPAGTVVVGKDENGRPVSFTTLTEATLHNWRVAALATLFVARPGRHVFAAPINSPSPLVDTVAGVYASAISDPAAGRGQGAAAQPWPLLGTDPTRSAANQPLVTGPVGFAVATPVLDLREGQRELTLRVQATAASFTTCWQLLNAAVPLVGVSGPGMLQPMFAATITGPAGWLPLTTLAVVADPTTHSLTWTLLLGRDQPAAVRYAPGTHGGRYTATEPLLRLLLNPQAPVYGYSYWATLQPVAIQLDVAVEHLRGVELHNQLGALDSRKPFYPFGAQARPGDYLQVGVPELLGKKLTSLTLALTWQNLPPEGLASNYAGYPEAVTNSSFTATASYLADYHWQPAPAQRPLQALFPAPVAAGTSSSPTLLRLTHPGYLDPAPTGTAGLVRLELAEPSMGFGAGDYPAALASTVRYNAHHAARPRPVPQPPFVPLLGQLTVSYTATARLLPSQGPQAGDLTSFYHLAPFAEYEPAAAGPVSLLPALPDEGTLYVGLEASAAGQHIDLVFDLLEPAPTNQPPPVVQWAYLDRDEWHPISQGPAARQVVPGFAATCRVQVRLPAALDLAHQVLPTGLCWLRATAANGAAALGQVRGVYAQLVRARRTGAGLAPTVPYQQPLGPGSLTQLLAPLPGIGGVAQPQASFGGRVAEDQGTYYARVGEQLRHRSRALTPWDYERLLLANFPQVYAARCLTADQLPPPRVPGAVWVVALPQSEVGSRQLPLFGAGELAEMQQYLQARASPAAQVLVHNPTYEAVQVHATVAFQPGLGGPAGGYEQQLQAELAAFLSPWGQAVPARSGFHHSLTVPAIEAFLTQRPYVASITGFSVVKTGLLAGRRRFYDSATDVHQPPVTMSEQVPWAVLVPALRQAIRVRAGHSPPQPPRPTGIGRLRVEEDFVVACDFEEAG